MKVGKAAAGLLGVVAAGAVGAAIASGCGGGGGGSSGGGDPPSCGNPGQPPCATGSPTTLTTRHNYAIHHLFLGDLDPATGQQSPTAWQNYGYDLDGKNTTASSIDVCRQSKTALAKEQADGPNGIDNSFGENLLPIIVQLDPSASASVNASIAQGKFTIMTDVTGFDDSAGNMTNATGLSGVILAGADISGSGAPTWTPSFDWAVRPELLDCAPNCQGVTDPAAHSTVKMTGSYQAAGTFVSGAPTEIDLSLSIAGTTIQLNILSAVVTFQPKSPGHVQNGIIAGVLRTSDVIKQIHSVVGFVAGGSLCSGAALQQIENEIQAASDIVVNGDTVSNDAGTMCDGITIGLGFDADEIALPTTIAPPSAGGSNPCDTGSDAGAD